MNNVVSYFLGTREACIALEPTFLFLFSYPSNIYSYRFFNLTLSPKNNIINEKSSNKWANGLFLPFLTCYYVKSKFHSVVCKQFFHEYQNAQF